MREFPFVRKEKKDLLLTSSSRTQRVFPHKLFHSIVVVLSLFASRFQTRESRDHLRSLTPLTNLPSLPFLPFSLPLSL